MFNARSATQSAFHGLFHNKFLWAAVLFGFLCQVAVVQVPFLQAAFGTVSMTLAQWLTSFALASLVLWVEELRKLWLRSRG